MNFNEYQDPIRVGDYEVRFLKNAEELLAFQKLRYEHLLLEFNPERHDKERIDYNDGYDEIASQLCVFDTSEKKEKLVGGYVLFRCAPDKICKTQSEFDISKLLKKHPNEVLDLSRAVVDPLHRNPIVLKLLWRGIEAYVYNHNLKYLIGTVSFKGIDPTPYLKGLSYVKENYRMDEDMMATSLQKHDLKLPQLDPNEIEVVKKQLPPLLRGYLMNGSRIGEGIFIDKDFNSVDVFNILNKDDYGLRRLK
ncbi:MAG: GNAT family N-acetyltransferase [Firmicutes bacterium]|nr:GNAT family N-acetyltransferase [Bacillota bacterium]